jgi:hypothetical protein
MGEIMHPITAEIVQNLIESFWKLNADRAPLSDFLPIVDHEGFFMELAGTDVRFSGIAGLGDHQIPHTGSRSEFRRFDDDLFRSQAT